MAASIILVWVHLFIALVAAYAVSFYFSAHTLIYLLMRKGVDETEFDEIAAPTEHEQDVDQEDKPAPRTPALPDKVEPG